MRNFPARFLSRIIFLTNASPGELFQLPALFNHYREGKVRNQTVSFFEFLKKHYAANLEHPEDSTRVHERLPLVSFL